MTTVALTPCPIERFVDNNGNALSGGQLFTYQAGTTTKTSVYTDSGGATPFPNPIVLNSRGEPDNGISSTSLGIWLIPGTSYKFVLAPATDTDPPTNAIWVLDQITVGSSGGGPQYVSDTGTTNALAVTLSPVPSAYAAGMSFFVSVANTTTGAATINVNGLGAKGIVFYGALASGALLAGNVYLLVYDAAGHFEVMDVPGQSGWMVNGMMAPMAAGTVKGNATGSTAKPTDIAISSIVSSPWAPGQYGFFSVLPLPSGWLAANGQTILRSTPLGVLYAAMSPAYPYGTGDGTATCNVPDFTTGSPFGRGYNASGPSAALGTLQTDAFQGHIMNSGVPFTTGSGAVGVYGDTTNDVSGAPNQTAHTDNNSPQQQAITSGPQTDGSHGTPRIASETRPANQAWIVAVHT